MSHEDLEREVPEEYAAIVRVLFAIKDETADLPEKIRLAFWRFKRLCDRAGMRITERELVTLAYLEGQGSPIGQEATGPSVLELYHNKEMVFDDPVDIMYRNKARRGKLKGVTAGNKVRVQIDGDAEEREVDADKVSRVNENELAGV